MSWLLSYSGKELHNIFSFLPILYHYIPFISRITIHLSHVSSSCLSFQQQNLININFGMTNAPFMLFSIAKNIFIAVTCC